jgi:hypothetical protein
VRRLLVVLVALAVVATACGDDDDPSEPDDPPATTTTAAGETTSTGATVSTTTTTVVLSTTSLPCATVPIPKTPVTSPAAPNEVYLTDVQELGDRCVDHVVFDFTSPAASPPPYEITYGSPPFTDDGSGQPVPIKGTAFVVVRLSPAYSRNFETNQPTYSGPKRIAPSGAKFVQEIVETGDFESVITWVIGLDRKRAFSVQATGAPRHQLVVTVG